MADFTNYISSYGKEVGLPNLTLNEQGVCSLTFDGKINVDIVYKHDQDQCIFAAPICDLPSGNCEEFFKKLLISNCFGTENGGAILGIEKEEDRVVLSYLFIASTFSFELFKTVLNNFVNLVEEWIDKSETLKNSYSSSANDEVSMPQPFEFTRI